MYYLPRFRNRLQQPLWQLPSRLRTGEVADEDVTQAIRSVPLHYAGWTHIQSRGTSTGASQLNSQACAYGSNVVANNVLIVWVATYGASSADFNPTVTDTQTNTWTQAGGFQDSGANLFRLSCWFAIAKSSAACTVTATLQNSVTTYIAVAVHEYNPPGGTVSVDTPVGNGWNNTNKTSFSPGACSASATELIATACNINANLTVTINNPPFNMRVSDPSNGSFSANLYTADCTNADAGGDTPTFSFGATNVNNGSALAISFKPAISSAGGGNAAIGGGLIAYPPGLGWQKGHKRTLTARMQ